MPLKILLPVLRWLLAKHTGALPLGPVTVGFTWRPPVRVAVYEGRRVYGVGLPHVFVWVRAT